mgnify:CR=1 FL=1
MSLFGSREEDPLLENDPLAPSGDSEESVSDEDAPDEDASPTGSVEEPDSTPSSSASDSSASVSEMGPPDTLPSDEEKADSVFSATSSHAVSADEKALQFDGQDDTRVVVHTAAEAGSGRLTVLNAALDEGWRLDRVELMSDPPDEESGPGSEDTRSAVVKLAFVLQKDAA